MAWQQAAGATCSPRLRIDFFVIPVAGVANESETVMPEAEAGPKFASTEKRTTCFEGFGASFHITMAYFSREEPRQKRTKLVGL